MGAPTPALRNLNRAREEQAEHELRDTRVARPVAAAWVAVFVLSLAVPLAVDAVARAGAGGEGPGWAALLDEVPTDCTLEAFETRLEERSWLAARLRPVVQGVLTAALGAGNEQVYPGADGWLYHRPDVDHLTGPPFLAPDVQQARVRGAGPCDPRPHPDPVAAIAALREDLAAYGVALVAVPTPPKAALHPERLAPGARPALQNPSWDDFVSALAAHGVSVFDPTSLLRARAQVGSAYLETDTHWRPEAVDAVAQALARHLEEMAELPAPTPRWTRVEAVVRNRGDLVTLLDLGDGGWFPPERAVIRPLRGPDGAAYASPASAPVLLLGDSYSNIYSARAAFATDGPEGALHWGAHAGLAEQLAFHLGRPVERIVRNAGGAHATRRALVRRVRSRGADALAGVRVVVYQFAARELSHGDWQPLPLPAPAEAAAPQPAAVAVAGELSGRVAARAALPEGGVGPYADALLALHLTEVAWHSGGTQAGGTSDVVVYVVGVRDREPTDAALLRPGQRVRLRVRPWDGPAVQDRWGSLARVELDDLDLLALPTFFGEPLP